MVGPFPVDAACLSFVLLPRLLQASPSTATYAVFTNGLPANLAGAIVPGTVRTFRPGQIVARLRR